VVNDRDVGEIKDEAKARRSAISSIRHCQTRSHQGLVEEATLVKVAAMFS
jgi:hypothetical protein